MATKSRKARDGRAFEPEIIALSRPLRSDADTLQVEIMAPAVGLWRGAPGPGTLILPGDALGELEILSVLHRLIAPPQARGVVVAEVADLARQPVAYGELLFTLDPEGIRRGFAADEETDSANANTSSAKDGRLAFRAPTSGRFYARPSPGKAPFVSVGGEISVGATVCLLEVMKTFNRVTFGGSGLPEVARVSEIVPHDGDDLAAGDVILYLDPLGATSGQPTDDPDNDQRRPHST